MAARKLNKYSVVVDRRDLFDFVRSEVKQALSEPDTYSESEAWAEAHRRTEDCLEKLLGESS